MSDSGRFPSAPSPPLSSRRILLRSRADVQGRIRRSGCLSCFGSDLEPLGIAALPHFLPGPLVTAASAEKCARLITHFPPSSHKPVNHGWTHRLLSSGSRTAFTGAPLEASERRILHILNHKPAPKPFPINSKKLENTFLMNIR